MSWPECVGFVCPTPKSTKSWPSQTASFEAIKSAMYSVSAVDSATVDWRLLSHAIRLLAYKNTTPDVEYLSWLSTQLPSQYPMHSDSSLEYLKSKSQRQVQRCLFSDLPMLNPNQQIEELSLHKKVYILCHLHQGLCWFAVSPIHPRGRM